MAVSKSVTVYWRPLPQWKPRAEQEPFPPNWFVLSRLALVWSTPVLASVKGCWRALLEATCTKSFCPNWSRLPQEGSLWRNFVTPQVTMGQVVQIFVRNRKLKILCRFRQDCPKERLKNVATERNSFLREHELIFNFSRRTVCPSWAKVTWAGSKLCIFRPWFHLFYYDIEIYQ